MTYRQHPRVAYPIAAGGQHGFTLIEVLVAISVLAVTMTAAFTLFSSGMKLRSATRDRLAFDRDARLVLEALADDFAHLVPGEPVPFVEPDSIVLLRTRRDLPGGEESFSHPELVTYQWAGSEVQDSLLVRLAVPLNVDIADSQLVHQEFQKWADRSLEWAGIGDRIEREDDGTRFGSSAALNGLSGPWVGFPRIGDFHFGIGSEGEQSPNELVEDNGLSRLVVHLREDSTERPQTRDPFRTWLPASTGTLEIEAGLWVPGVATRQWAVPDFVDEGGAS